MRCFYYYRINYKTTLVDIKGLNKHFYKECDRCLKAYNIFIEGINKHLYECKVHPNHTYIIVVTLLDI